MYSAGCTPSTLDLLSAKQDMDIEQPNLHPVLDKSDNLVVKCMLHGSSKDPAQDGKRPQGSEQRELCNRALQLPKEGLWRVMKKFPRVHMMSLHR